MNDTERLRGYVDVWWRAVGDFLDLLGQLPAEEWSVPTDLPGWDVHDCAAHTAHLESVLAGGPEETLELEVPPHVRGILGLYTEQGVVARRGRSPAELMDEIRESCTTRHEQLLTTPPVDGAAKPEVIFGGVGWSWETLLRNRPLDVWMHDQDVRRAVGRPGGLDAPAAQHTADYLIESLAMVLAKRVAAAPGTTLVVEVEGSDVAAFGVGEDGRGARLPAVPDEPSARISLSREAFVVLAGGRRTPEQVPYDVSGDTDLAARVLSSMAVTP